jgi:hypothetical protein
MSIVNDLRNAREFLSLGRDIVQLLLEIGRLLKRGETRTAEEILQERNQAEAASRAAYEASNNAGKEKRR